MAVFAQDEFVFLWNFSHIISIFERQIDDPACDKNTEKKEETGNYNIGNIPSSGGLKVSELPESEEDERNVTEPERLIDSTKSNSSLEDSPTESSQFVEFVDTLVLQ